MGLLIGFLTVFMKFTNICKFTTKFIATLVVFISASSVFSQNISQADVVVKDAWVRSSVPGQHATGAFMTLTAKNGLKLVSVSSPAAGITEVHEMKMEGDIMKMRPVPGGLDLPAGKVVELKPGGYHIMLMDLKAPLTKDSSTTLTLVFKDTKGQTSKIDLKAPVTSAPPNNKPGVKPTMDMSEHKH